MMSEKQYRVARKGIIEQIKLAQKLHCTNLEKKHKAALKKLELRFLKPCHRLLRLGKQNIK